MKKKVFGRKLSRNRNARKALFRSLFKALVINSAIVTTKAKAKAIQGDVDKLVNLAKDGSVAKKRQLYARLANDRETTNRLYEIVEKNFEERAGGYTRIVNLPTRRGDRALMVRFEWVEEVVTKEEQRVTSDKKKEKIVKSESVKEKIKTRITKSKDSKKK